jgi:hypothetical protein
MLLVKGAPATKNPDVEGRKSTLSGSSEERWRRGQSCPSRRVEVPTRNLKKKNKKGGNNLWQISYRKPM